MKLRNAGLLVVVLAAAASCKKAQPTADRQPQAPSVSAPRTGSGAPANDPWSQPEAKKDPLQKPLLWSIEKDGNISYALGTMHIGVDAQTRLPDIVWKALDQSKTFAMEMDIHSVKLDALRKDGTTLQQELGPDYWKKLEDALGVADAARVLNLKPMIPAMQLSMRGLPMTAPMDGVLHGRATNQNKKIVFLETGDHQMTVVEKWMNARALKDMLDDVPAVEASSTAMLAAYLSGDDAKIVAIADSEREKWKKRGRPETEYAEQMEDLLYKRNAAWIPAIEKLHADGGGFIAVGALHLVGPRSVLELLAAKGYKVTRITP